jgi:hypothetical protein
MVSIGVLAVRSEPAKWDRQVVSTRLTGRGTTSAQEIGPTPATRIDLHPDSHHGLWHIGSVPYQN